MLKAIEEMVAAGAEIKDVTIPHAAEARLANWVTMLSEAYTYHEQDIQTRPEVYGRYTVETIRRGAFMSAADYVQAQRVRVLVKAECATALDGLDVLVTPTMINTAPTFEGWSTEAMLVSPSYTGIWNLTGFPALSVPCGFASNGLPVGMQIIGRPFAEPVIFAASDAYQQITDWHLRVPETMKELSAV